MKKAHGADVEYGHLVAYKMDISVDPDALDSVTHYVEVSIVSAYSRNDVKGSCIVGLNSVNSMPHLSAADAIDKAGSWYILEDADAILKRHKAGGAGGVGGRADQRDDRSLLYCLTEPEIKSLQAQTKMRAKKTRKMTKTRTMTMRAMRTTVTMATTRRIPSADRLVVLTMRTRVMMTTTRRTKNRKSRRRKRRKTSMVGRLVVVLAMQPSRTTMTKVKTMRVRMMMLQSLLCLRVLTCLLLCGQRWQQPQVVARPVWNSSKFATAFVV
jgi:hypothetical protein